MHTPVDKLMMLFLILLSEKVEHFIQIVEFQTLVFVVVFFCVWVGGVGWGINKILSVYPACQSLISPELFFFLNELMKKLQSNFDGSNPFRTMKICSRQR